jgi:hypothetical protein
LPSETRIRFEPPLLAANVSNPTHPHPAKREEKSTGWPFASRRGLRLTDKPETRKPRSALARVKLDLGKFPDFVKWGICVVFSERRKECLA